MVWTWHLVMVAWAMQAQGKFVCDPVLWLPLRIQPILPGPRAEGELHLVPVLVGLLTGQDRQHQGRGGIHAGDALHEVCHLDLLGLQLRCVG